MNQLITAIATGATLIAASAAMPALAHPTFDLHYVAGTSLQAQQGFQAAAARWSSLLKDNVTIDLTVGFNSLGGNILGQAASTEAFYDYATVRDALGKDATSFADQVAVAHLAPGASFGLMLNRTASSPTALPYLDNNGDANNSTLYLSNAEAKALKLAVPSPVPPPSFCIGNCDGFIQFNSDFAFDFNPDNGITPGTIDFIGVAMHEIGHTLGFISGVDILDFNSPPIGGPFNDDEFTYVSGLDLFRYSALSTASGAIDWSADNRAKYFSIDGGASVGPLFSNGVFHGDGRQASHWKDQLGIGIMDPTAAFGEKLDISRNDLRALDVIGWDVIIEQIPVPGTLPLFAIALSAMLALALARRGRTMEKTG